MRRSFFIVKAKEEIALLFETSGFESHGYNLLQDTQFDRRWSDGQVEFQVPR